MQLNKVQQVNTYKSLSNSGLKYLGLKRNQKLIFQNTRYIQNKNASSASQNYDDEVNKKKQEILSRYEETKQQAQQQADAEKQGPQDEIQEEVKKTKDVQKSPNLSNKDKLASLGTAGVIAYGLFDAFTYTIFFSVAFLSYQAKTGLNPTKNLRDIGKIMILMWAGNNVTRPFRIAGSVALAPVIRKIALVIKQRFKLKSEFLGYALIVLSAALLSFSVAGTLFITNLFKP